MWLLILIPVMLISIGYSVLNSNVGMSGKTNIGDLVWDVHIIPESIHYTDGSSTGVNNSAPTIVDGSLTYDVSLPTIGDYYEFDFQIVNDGTIPAKLKEIRNTANENPYIRYTYKYLDDSAITIGDSLRSKDVTTMVVRIDFSIDSSLSEEEINNIDKTANSQISFVYQQANPDELTNSYVDVRRKTTNTHAVINEIPNSVTSTTNIYETYLSHGYPNEYCVNDSYEWNNNGNVSLVSVTIPVIPGDYISANSFKDKTQNGSGTTDGVRVSFLNDSGLVSSMSDSEVYNTYSDKGYIIVPDNVTAINVPYYNVSESNYLYILNP